VTDPPHIIERRRQIRHHLALRTQDSRIADLDNSDAKLRADLDALIRSGNVGIRTPR
jgi:hypothetical protein